MTKTDRSAGRTRAVSAAVRRFPRFELTIHRLMDRSESFRDMCEELADAELALSKVDEVRLELREPWRVEWEELVDRLAGEVEAVLNTDTGRKLGTTPRPPR